MLEKSTLQSVAMDTMLRSRRAALIRPERKQHLQVQSLRLANKLSARREESRTRRSRQLCAEGGTFHGRAGRNIRGCE